MNVEHGYYDAKGLAQVEINNNKSLKDAEYTTLHELVHKVLTESTTYGAVVFFITQVIGCDETPQDVKKTLNGILTILFDKMRTLQEGLAAFVELSYVKLNSDKEYQKRLAEYERQPIYNNTVFKLLNQLENVDFDTDMGIIFEMAVVSMNVDLEHLRIYEKKFDKYIGSNQAVVKLINPNVRFRTLLKCYKTNRTADLQELLRISDITYTDFTQQTIEDWASKNIINKYNLLPFEKYVVFNSTTDSNEHTKLLLQGVGSYVSELKYSVHNSPDQITDGEKDGLRYISKYYNGVFQISYIDVVMGTIFCCADSKFDQNVKRCKAIMCDRFYYPSIRDSAPQIDNYLVFVKLNGMFDPFATKFISEYSEKLFHFHEINTTTCAVFIKGPHRTYLFDIFPKIQLREVVAFLKEHSHNYVNISSADNLDMIFYHNKSDWCVFEDVLSFWIQRKLLCVEPGEFVDLRHRINIAE